MRTYKPSIKRFDTHRYTHEPSADFSPFPSFASFPRGVNEVHVIGRGIANQGLSASRRSVFRNAHDDMIFHCAAECMPVA